MKSESPNVTRNNPQKIKKVKKLVVPPKMAYKRLPTCPKRMPITDERIQEVKGMTTSNIKRLFLV
jgi:hypothetical protein